jgi:hypothetical protein
LAINAYKCQKDGSIVRSMPEKCEVAESTFISNLANFTIMAAAKMGYVFGMTITNSRQLQIRSSGCGLLHKMD